MTKKEMTKAFALAQTQRLQPMYDKLLATYTVKLVKPPYKTLVMLKARESAKNSLFYLGEALASSCVVQVEGHKGFALALGDDFNKVTMMAVLDGAVQAGLPEQADVMRLAETLQQEQAQQRAIENGRILESKVSFDVMEA